MLLAICYSRVGLGEAVGSGACGGLLRNESHRFGRHSRKRMKFGAVTVRQRLRLGRLVSLLAPGVVSLGCTRTGRVSGTRNRVSLGLLREFRDAGRSGSRP